MTAYEQFLESKALVDKPSGFEPHEIKAALFDWQKDIVRWAIRRGRAACFEDCGLGKTIQELEWGKQVAEETGGMVLHLAPLAVGPQIRDEAAKFGYEVNMVEYQAACQPGVNITNFEKLDRFNADLFSGVIVDESSIMKSFAGVTRTKLIERFRGMPYKSAWTATPAPNDFMELANHAEFLGIMTRSEMLATFFAHDSGSTQTWRLKEHGRDAFWKWLCSWAVNIRNPSDLGYDGSDFILPELTMEELIVDSDHKLDGYLIAMPASNLQERRQARRASLGERVAAIVDIFNVKHRFDQFIVWCDLNDESASLAQLIDGAKEVAGKHDEQYRIDALQGFISGKYRGLVTKPDIFGFGMNFQHCHLAAYCGLSDSWELFYQSARRIWRFGQNNPVTLYVVISSQEGAVLSNIKRKEADAQRMNAEMLSFMKDIQSKNIRRLERETECYNPQTRMDLPSWIA